MEHITREKPSPVKLENIARHLANLALYTGFLHGKYFIEGVYHPKVKTSSVSHNHHKSGRIFP